jgi:hypothetical protein
VGVNGADMYCKQIYKNNKERNRRTFRAGGHIRALSSKICRKFKDVGHIRTLFFKKLSDILGRRTYKTLSSKNCRTFKDVGHIRTSDI